MQHSFELRLLASTYILLSIDSIRNSRRLDIISIETLHRCHGCLCSKELFARLRFLYASDVMMCDSHHDQTSALQPGRITRSSYSYDYAQKLFVDLNN
jgi:hypothetical protein